MVKASIQHQHRDAVQWQHHHIKRNRETFSNVSNQLVTTANKQQQQQHHVHRCKVNGSSIAVVAVAMQHALACIRENFKLNGNNQLVALQQFCCQTMIAATAKKQWAMAIECQWGKFAPIVVLQ